MDLRHRETAERLRALITSGRAPPPPQLFSSAFLSVPAAQRDEWVDLVLGLGTLPDDGPALPTGCTPYLPCPIDALLQLVQHVPVQAADTFIDVGAGIGRACAFVNLMTGAEAVGLEVQPELVRGARELAARLPGSRLSIVEGDAVALTGELKSGSVFFLYCPFSGDRLEKVLAALEPLARKRALSVCTVNLPLPPCSWLKLEQTLEGDLAIYRSTL